MQNVTRRGIVAAMGAAGAGTCLCGVNSGCATFSKVGDTPPIAAGAYAISGKTLRIALDKVPELGTVGGAVKIIDTKLPKPLIVARAGESDYAVVSLLCPHRGVEVEYRHADQQFRCASLGHSRFAKDGKLKRGPSKKPLNGYTAALDPADKNGLLVTF
jgi:Rieske Fe-S protein